MVAMANAIMLWFRIGPPGPTRGTLIVARDSCQDQSSLTKTDLTGLGSSLGSVVPILGAGDVGQPPLMAVPPVDAVHLGGPESGPHGGDDGQADRVPDLHASPTVE